MRVAGQALRWVRTNSWVLSLAVIGLVVVGGTAFVVALATPDAPRADAARATAPAPVTVVPAAPVTAPATVPAPGVPAAAAAEPQRPGPAYYRRTTSRHVPAAAEAGYLPLYEEAERVFGVSWRLVASIHRQETAFSTEPSTYHGRNAFGCCAGPMQFNVTNGPVSTWKRYRGAFRQAVRPASYPHPTRSHPSIYDDFDAIMAAGALLRDAGATRELSGASWLAAYGYYGHDLFGITYADQVIARARNWQRGGFCVNCSVAPGLIAALDDAYGVHEREALLAAERAAAADEKQAKRKKAAARAKRARARRAKAKAAETEAAGAGRRPAASAKEGPATTGASGTRRPARPARRRPSTAPQPARTTQTQTTPPPATSSSSTSTAPPPATTSTQATPPPCTPLAGALGCGG